jgi:LPXTG-motif cell wall-anchored protein
MCIGAARGYRHPSTVRTTVPPVRRRLATLAAALTLAAPATALAQGAGDDQYQDPFGDPAAQGTGGKNDGLSTKPKIPGSTSGASNSNSGSSGAGGSSGSGTTPAAGSGAGTATGPATPSQSAPARSLPNTGSDPRLLALLGVALLLVGIGLRLRTLDPDAF